MALDEASLLGLVFINDVIYAELSVRYESVGQVGAFVGQGPG